MAVKNFVRQNFEKMKDELCTGIICDVMDQMGYNNQALGNGIQPLMDETIIFGPAFTALANEVYSMPEDPLTAQAKIVDQLQEGEVFVLATRGKNNCATFGDLFATRVKSKKGAGVLLDSYARDLRELKKMNFPLFYKGSNPLTSKGRTEINESHLPILIDGVTIKPGDYIYGDVDGICVIPQEIVEEVIKRAEQILEDERVVRKALEGGMSIEDAYKINGAI